MFHGVKVLFPSQDSALRLSPTSSHHLKTLARFRIGLQHILKVYTHTVHSSTRHCWKRCKSSGSFPQLTFKETLITRMNLVLELAVVAHTNNPSTQKVEAGGFLI